MNEQIGINFNVTGNMSGVTGQINAMNSAILNASVSAKVLDRSLANVDLATANRQFVDGITKSGMFNTRMVTLATSTERYGQALEKGTLSGRKYWQESIRYLRGERGEIRLLAREQVALNKSRMLMTGRDAMGRAQGTVVTPAGVDMRVAGNQMEVLNKELSAFRLNSLRGAEAMVNLGKNTQWAGRQLMVGFTVPLMMAGGLAAKTFYDLDQQLVRLQKVYGSGFSFGDDFIKQSKMIREEGIRMAKEMASTYGQAGSETVGLMSELAAAGYEGADLTKLTTATTKLSLLGEVDKQEAMKATISLQTAFGLSTEQVAEKVLFLNAVENQTSTSLGDLVEAIPRAGTVIEGLGGSVEDLALYMTAMREGGISAAEGANALKSGLSSIIAPPKAATEFMKEFGINLPKLVNANAGDLTGTLLAFQEELAKLDDLARQQVITKLFGKYQFARMNAFFNNLGAEGSQTVKVLDLMGYSVEQLGQIADQELGAIQQSVSGKFNQAWQTLKINLAEVGELFMKFGTVVIDIFNGIFSFLNNHEWVRNMVVGVTAIVGAIGPLIMLAGLGLNMFGMMLKTIIKVGTFIKAVFSGAGRVKAFQLMTADSWAAEQALTGVTDVMFNQQKASEILEQHLAELDVKYRNLAGSAEAAAAGMTSVTASAQGTARTTQTGYSRSQVEFGHHMPLNPARKIEDDMIRRIFTTGTNGYQDRYGALPDWNAYADIGPNQRPFIGQLGGTAISSQANADAGAMTQYFAPDIARGGRVSFSDPRMAKAVAASAVDPMTFLQDKVNIMVNELGVEASDAKAWMDRWSVRLKAITADSLTLEQAQEQLILALRDAAAVAGGAKVLAPGNQGAGSQQAGSYEKIGGKFGRVAYEQLTEGVGSILVADRAVAEMGASAALAAERIQGFNLSKAQQAELRLAAAFDKSSANFKYLDNDYKLAGESALKLAKGFTQIDPASVDGAFDFLHNKAIESGIDLEGVSTSFVAVENGNRQYAAILNAESGEILAMGGRTGSGAMSGINPARATNVAESMRLGNINVSDAHSAAINAALSKALDIAASSLVIEQKIAALRAEGLITAEGTLNIQREGLTMEQKATAEDIEQLLYEERQTAMKKAGLGPSSIPQNLGGAGIPTKTQSFMVQNGSLVPMPSAPPPKVPWYKQPGTMNKAMGVAGMGMMASMIPTGDNLTANAVLNTTGGAAMGASMGVMGGPWGMALGAAIGAGISGGGAISAALNEENAKALAEIKKEWDSLSTFMGDTMSEDLGKVFDVKKYNPEAIFKEWANPIKIDIDPSSYDQNMDKFNQDVADSFAAEIEAMANATAELASDEAVLLYNKLIMTGFKPEKAAKIIESALMAANRKDIVLEVRARILPIDSAGEARSSMQDVLRAQADAQANNLMGTFGVGVPWNRDDQMQDSASLAAQVGVLDGQAYATGIRKGAKPEEIMEGFWNTAIPRAQQIIDKNEIDWSHLVDLADEVGQTDFGLSGNLTDDLEIIFGTWSAEKRQEFFDALSQDGQKAFSDLNSYLSSTANVIGESLPDGWDLAYAAMAPNVTNAFALLDTLRQMADVLEDDVAKAYGAVGTAQAGVLGMIPEPTVSEEDISDLEKSQEKEEAQAERAAERQKEAIADQREALQEQQEMLNEAVDKINDRYDKEIKKIEEAEDARQKAFEKEQERYARRQEMRNMELSYQEAVASGELFEAARIRMDINATKNQNASQDANEKASEAADRKIKNLESDRNKELKFYEKKLKAIEKEMEALDDQEKAIDDHVEAVKDANEKELKSVKETRQAEVEEAQKLADKINAIWENSNLTMQQKLKKSMGIIGTASKAQAQAFLDIWQGAFGEMGDDAQKEIVASIRSGDWGQVMSVLADELGMSKSDLNQISKLVEFMGDSRFVISQSSKGDWYVKPSGVRGDVAEEVLYGDGNATGGYISGPGSATSDSIPARLSNGEYVIRAASVQKYGKSFFDQLNRGPRTDSLAFPGGTGTYAKGGMVGAIRDSVGVNAATLVGIKKAPVTIMQSMLQTLAKFSGGSSGGRGGGKGKASAGSGVVGKMVQFVLDQMGEDYVLGASGPNQWDCSGLTAAAAALAGYSLPHAASLQYEKLNKIPKNSARAGDLAFFNPGNNLAGPGTPGHVGLMINGQQFVHAASRDLGVIKSSLNTTTNDYVGMGRIPGLRSGGKINYDNTLANLHKGETVLTQPLTDKWDKALANMGETEYNINVTVNNPSSEIDIERALLNAMSKQERKMGRNRTVR